MVTNASEKKELIETTGGHGFPRLLIYITLFIILAPVVYFLIRWNEFPQEVPTHLDINGNVDGTMKKGVGLLLMPGMNLVIFGFMLLVPSIDPNKFESAANRRLLGTIVFALAALLSVISLAMAQLALGDDWGVDKIVMLGVGLLTLIIGNSMLSIKQNYFIGIRTPWTLSSEKVWRSTHRFTAFVWIAVSLAYIILTLIFGPKPAVLFTYIGLLVLPPLIYSYIAYIRESK